VEAGTQQTTRYFIETDTKILIYLSATTNMLWAIYIRMIVPFQLGLKKNYLRESTFLKLPLSIDRSFINHDQSIQQKV
jgi:hypothetical protein